MKSFLSIFVLLLFLLLAACDPAPRLADSARFLPGHYPGGVYRFDDGQITCYVYYQHAISCVRK